MKLQESPALVSPSITSTRKPRSDLDEITEFNRKGLFVGGCPKSGTTLLLSLLDSHPQLVVFPRETHYLDERRKYEALTNFSAKLERLLGRSELRLLEQVWRESEQGNGEMGSRCTFDDTGFVRLANEFVDRPWINDSFLLSETVRAYAVTMGLNWQECARWVEKTPSNVPYAEDLFRLFPDAKLLHIMRDPRAVFASRRRLLLDRYGSYAKAHRFVREWNESSRQIKQLADRSGNYLVIWYEDLIRNSRSIMEEVCQFAEIDFLPSLLEPTRAGKGWVGNSAFHNTFKGIDKQPVNQWKKELTEDEIWWIEFHCGEGMRLAGYELLTDAKFSARRWAKRLPGESLGGYLRARKSSLCQMADLLPECRYDSD